MSRGGRYGNVLRLQPYLSATAGDADFTLTALDEAFATLK